MSRGTSYSAVLHTFLLLLAIFGLPSLFNATRELEPQVITVDILPIGEISNVKPAEVTPQKEPEKKEEPKPTPNPKDTKKPVPKTKQEEAAPAPKLTEKAKDVVKEKPKEEDKKDKKKKQQEDFDAVLRSVDNAAQKNEAPKDKNASSDSKSKSQSFDPEIPLSLSEKDAIRSQFIKCWNMPAGAKDAQNLIVVLHIKVAQDGSVTSVDIASRDEGRYASDNFFRAAVDSAQRAVKKCSPLQGLSADKYGSWKEMELTFDPHDLLY